MTTAKTGKLIVGNWKMNGLREDAAKRAQAIGEAAQAEGREAFDIVLCPPATLLSEVRAAAGKAVALGAQDCHHKDFGAYTGNISALMLKDAGCSYVILGHSERRQLQGETSEQVAAKAHAALNAGLVAIICVGETDAERTAGQQNDVVAAQLEASLPEGANKDNTVIAYEPVWAIGTGKTASAEDVRAMHAHIREIAGVGMRILYGGSVKAANAAEILHTENVDGVLVGGASLIAEDFLAIARAS